MPCCSLEATARSSDFCVPRSVHSRCCQGQRNHGAVELNHVEPYHGTSLRPARLFAVCGRVICPPMTSPCCADGARQAGVIHNRHVLGERHSGQHLAFVFVWPGHSHRGVATAALQAPACSLLTRGSSLAHGCTAPEASHATQRCI